MIALDTNVLVRFLVRDDEAQSAKAATLVRRTIAANDKLYVGPVVLCELVWVLEVSYKVPRVEIAQTLDDLLRAEHVVVDDADGLARALAAFRAGKGDLADYVIRAQAKAAGCEVVATFDRALLREPGFVRP